MKESNKLTVNEQLAIMNLLISRLELDDEFEIGERDCLESALKKMQNRFDDGGE